MSTSGQKFTLLWELSKVIKSLRRYDPGAAKYRQRFDAVYGRGRFVKFRRREFPDGTTRKTVEIWID